MARSFLSERHASWSKNEPAGKKKSRAIKAIMRLKKAYPNAKIVLKYGNEIQLLVAVILSAQCTDKKVNEVTAKLFKTYKTAEDFAKADLRALEKAIKSTGFFHSKAMSIKTACQMIVAKFGGKLPQTMNEMLQLRGVARKTANVVLGNAFGLAEGIAVDTHVRRLAQRLGFTENDNPDIIEKDLMALIPKKDWFKLTYLLIEHGRAVCQARKPDCVGCVLKNLCPSGRL
ncbi:MAG: endonuclease III [bacterium]|nr:endonuclease III [bacterium]